MIRTPIIAFLGHVDAGKTTLQDHIRKTAVARSEPGEITQSIGASIVPMSTIKNLCSKLIETTKFDLIVPGLLMIDTPGHAAFVSLRKRGGTLADLAVLVIDINEGLKLQTIEAIQILRQFKTPFLIAANKIDAISGWRSKDGTLLQSIGSQEKNIQTKLDTLLYEIVGKLSEHGFESERYDRVDDYARKISIIPCSAKSGEGVAELLMMAAGLSQKFLGNKLNTDTNAPARGTVLEVKTEKGMGLTLDVIIYDGVLRKGDEIVIGGMHQPIITKVRALLEPKPLNELRNSNFGQVNEVIAATGVKLSATGIEDALAGMPIMACGKNKAEAIATIQKEIHEFKLDLDHEGIVAKADTLGSLEALLVLLRKQNVKIMKAAIGDITRKDVSDAATNLNTNPLNAAVLGFNVGKPTLTTMGVQLITDKVIYTLIERLEQWQKIEKEKLEKSALHSITKPCKIMLMKGYVFRQNNPAIVGTQILLGTLQNSAPLMKSGKLISTVKEIQDKQENVAEAKMGLEVAVSYQNVMIGRQINEGDTLYSMITEDEYRKLKELKTYLTEDEKSALREIAAIMRAENPVWGI